VDVRPGPEAVARLNRKLADAMMEARLRAELAMQNSGFAPNAASVLKRNSSPAPPVVGSVSECFALVVDP
jgi:hypothetical protein